LAKSYFSHERIVITSILARNALSDVEFVSHLTGASAEGTQSFLREWDSSKSLAVLSKEPVDTTPEGAIHAITRFTKPLAVVETGVRPGVSSTAFLTAMNVNGVGEL
jgi:hypothetical protein